jgi:murein L,D-transpeptidase YcbB/YkuD
MGEFHVWDNVPEYLTRVVKNGQVILRDEIVVGQPSWPTPVFSAPMKTIVFRPSWGVPNGIKTKELAPLLRKSNSGGGGLFGLFGGGYSAQAVLDAHDLQAYQNGRRIDPNTVNWAAVDIRAYHFTQPPGPKNVLGEVKFMFPNKHDVYMHDTPQRHLFAKSYRALSHGCLRVHHPRRFAEVLLEHDKGWSSSQVGNMFSRGGEIALSTHIPVHITYMTARVDDNGKLHTFGDFYGHDSRTAAALTGRSIRFEQQPADLDAIAEAEGRPQQQRRAPQRKQQYSNSSPNSLSDVIQGLFSP